MRFCILGGGGSFAQHLARYLLLQPKTEQILAIGRSQPKPPCFRFKDVDDDMRFVYVPLHITYDHIAVMRLLDFTKPEVIINFAAQGEGATSFTESWRYFETNCVGLAKLVEQVQSRDWLEQFIHIGSSEVYGSTINPADEWAPLKPTSPYAISKAAFDQYLLALTRKNDFPATIVRPSNCYGELQQLHRFIPKAFLFGMTGRKVPLHGGGKAEKSYLHSEDLARAIHLMITARAFGVWNVGPPDPTPMVGVARMIAAALDMPVEQLCDIAPDRDHQDARYWLASNKIRGIGWEPQVKWSDGLVRVRDWVKDNLEELQMQPIDFVMRP